MMIEVITMLNILTLGTPLTPTWSLEPCFAGGQIWWLFQHFTFLYLSQPSVKGSTSLLN